MAHSPPSSPGARPPYQSIMASRESPPCSPSARPMHLSSSASAYPSRALPIRGSQVEIAPPALPPPRDAPVGMQTRDTWAERQAPRFSGSIPQSSSLFGGGSFSRPPVARPPHKSSLSLSHGGQMPPSPLRDLQFQRNIKQEDGAPQLPSLPSLHGRPLESHNHQKSTETYDKQLLSKLGPGRPKTPPRPSTLTSLNTSPVEGGRPLRLDTQPALHRLTLADRSLTAYPESPLKTSSPFTRWSQLPQSGTISPSIMSSTASTRSLSLAELRSPGGSYEPSTAPSSLSAEQATFSRFGSFDRGSNASLSLLSSAFDDAEQKSRNAFGRGPPEWGRASRGSGSFDHPMFPADEHDAEFAAQGPVGLRHQRSERDREREPHPAALEGSLPDMGGPQGVKRKASPSLGDTVADEPPPQAVRSRTPGRTTKRTSPGHQAPPTPAAYGSHSTASVHTASYASSNLSLAPSSVTSYGTPDHRSCAGTSIVSEDLDRRLSQSSYAPSAGHDSLASQSTVASVHPSASQTQPPTGPQPDIVSAKTARDGGIVAAHIHVCDCCPKKPKKFNTLEELQTHQREKQFYCTYCHNRFKNKNEAERHQNSLHLRRNSWSCAALGNKIDRAFHACTATPSANPLQPQAPPNPPAEFDVCGYCGKNFPNYPAPDWSERNKHLTEVHKFGECNQSKKFFRADHFRQHLKHSHQGSSGKWTNMLEQACLREEMPIGVEASAQDSRQQAASQALQAVQAASQQAPITSYQVEALQAATSAAPPPLARQYTSAIGSHVPYEPKIDEEDEARV